MKLRSIVTTITKMRSNAVFCLVFAILSSLQTLISCVTIQPQEKVKAIWNTDTLFVTCSRDKGHSAGSLKWFRGGVELDDDSRAPVYQKDGHNHDKKLIMMNVSPKYSGTYECRHIKDGRTISSDKFELKVFTAIDMEGNKDSYIGTEGGPFSMPCLAKFDSDSTETSLSWSHNNNPIKSDERNYTITKRLEESVERKNVKSTLTIKHLTKEDEGTYTCESVYANAYLTNMKNIDINLRVQFKPRLLENIQKNVWVSDEVQPPVRVNITCAVNADPVANFKWFTGNNRSPLDKKRSKHSIHESENLSVLTLEYRNIDEIRNSFNNPQIHKHFECVARNEIGETANKFELNVGKLPESPILANISYSNGLLLVVVNDTKVEPPIDIYRLDIADNHQIYFNASNRIENSNQFQIAVDVPSGVHNMILLAHNPVGWSEAKGPNPPLELVVGSSSFAIQSYIGFVMFASALSLVNAL